jgi:hypothetical protein
MCLYGVGRVPGVDEADGIIHGEPFNAEPVPLLLRRLCVCVCERERERERERGCVCVCISVCARVRRLEGCFDAACVQTRHACPVTREGGGMQRERRKHVDLEFSVLGHRGFSSVCNFSLVCRPGV